MAYRSIAFKPTEGGALMADVSEENVGLANYVRKQNFRRFIDREIRQEGYDYFDPKDASIGMAPFPSQSEHPVIFLHEAERPNGEKAILAGVQEDDGIHIYRYRGTDNGLYVKAGYWAQYYTIESFNDWYELTETPLRSGGERLHAITINGTIIINNGIDLPLAWKFTWNKARPLYQLRENGIISAKVASEYNGMAFFCNVTQSSEIDLFATDPYGPYNGPEDRFYNRVVTSQINDALKFAAAIPGSIKERSYRFDLDGHPLSLEPGQEIVIPGAGIEEGNLYAKIIAVKPQGEANGPIKAYYKYTVVATAPGGVVAYNGKNYTAGMSFYGEPGVTSAVITEPSKTFLHRNSYVLLDTRAQSEALNTTIADSNAVDSTASFMDLADDGHEILNAAPLQNALVVYKDNEFVHLEFTGDPTDPFRYRLIPAGDTALYFKNTLINIDGRQHFFAGRERFFTFGLADSAPVELPTSRLTDSIFFSNAFQDTQNAIFSSRNPLTNEIWVCYAHEDTTRHVLRFNYLDRSFGTSDIQTTAAIPIYRPGSTKNETWFILGFGNGTICLYGLADRPLARWGNKKSIFYRRSTFNLSNPASQTTAEYTSILESGRGDFGDEFNEKTLERYVLQLASMQAQGVQIKVRIQAYENPFDTSPRDLMDDTNYIMAAVETRNTIPMYGVGYLFKETLTIEGKNNPAEIAARIYNVDGVRTQSFDRSI